MKTCLKGLDPKEYQHPLDGKALDALKAVPGLNSVTATITKLVERTAIIQCTGSNLEITKENYPELLCHLEEVCEVLDIPSLPRLYVEWDDAINAHTVGSEQPIIVLSSGCVDRLGEDELKFILGHECGHIKSRHQQYSLALS